MKKLATPLSQKEVETIRRLSIDTRRLAHRLKAEKAKFYSREEVNTDIALASKKLREIFGPELASSLASKITGLSAGEALRVCRDEKSAAFDQFRSWIDGQLNAKNLPVEPEKVIPFRHARTAVAA